MLKVLFLGDIVGKIGRKAVAKYLPKLKDKYKPDLIIANGENLAHGIGFTQKTIDEMLDAGVDVFTSGNHAWQKGQSDEVLDAKNSPVIRPANFLEKKSGKGVKRLKIKGKKIVLVNLLGEVFMKEKVSLPFKAMERILHKCAKNDIVIVDLHGEATSEKNAFVNYFSGKVSAVFGTHTHVPTCDAKIVGEHAAFVSDAGMIGYYDSVIGAKKEEVYKIFLATGSGAKKHDLPDFGRCQFNAIYVEIDTKTGAALKIKRLDKIISIK